MSLEDDICMFGTNHMAYRGLDVPELMNTATWPQTIILMLTGELPHATDSRCPILTALLIAWADHGTPPPSTAATRAAASVGVPLIPAAISAFAMFGHDHAPVDLAVKMLQFPAGTLSCLEEKVERGEKLPGFGHPVHSEDPRAVRLFMLAEEAGLENALHRNLLAAIRHRLFACGKRVEPNLAGITAALWLDMDFPPESVGVIALMGRSLGLAAHHSEVVRSGSKFIGTP